MKHVAYENGAHVCYTTTTGRDRHYLGCSHETPRQAIAHKTPTFIPASRRADQYPDGTVSLAGEPDRASREAADPLTGPSDPRRRPRGQRAASPAAAYHSGSGAQTLGLA